MFIITERNIGTHAELSGNEGFLADAIINMGWTVETVNSFGRSQVEKMRHVRHNRTSKPSRWGRTVSMLLGSVVRLIGPSIRRPSPRP